jgi:hypothetical protein
VNTVSTGLVGTPQPVYRRSTDPHCVSPPPPPGRQQMCHHDHRVPVEIQPSGDLVAQLCLDCDAQLPADWIPRLTWCPYGELPTFPPVHDLPEFVPDPRLTHRIQE